MLLHGRNGFRAKGSAKVMNAGTEEPAPCSQDIDLSSVGENNLEENESYNLSRELQSTSSVVGAKNKERTGPSENDKEVLVSMSESISDTILQRMTLDTPGNILPHSAKNETEAGFSAPFDEYPSKGTMREKSILNKESRKPELKPLHMLLNDESTTPGDVNVVGKHRLKEGKVKSTQTSVHAVDGNVKVNIGAGSEKNLNLKKESNSSLQYSSIDSEEKLVSKKFNGKVKEFVKIFNEEAPVKSIKNAESESQRFGVRERSIGKGGEEEANVAATRGDMKERLTSSSSRVHQAPKDSARPPLTAYSKSYKIDEISDGREKSSISCSESTPESFSSGIGHMEMSDSADLFCQVEELPHEKEMKPQIPKTMTKPQSQIAKNKEIIQDSDARIKQWSTGKEANIRSLLSTMQYVLWPESGWKPVPLVDIIESNSVKRAYQKALLCLHPDKLQQKGAAVHQKYIAEKVFDILQEAWTHFNSLGSF
ncbi:hypothetical protein Scep_020682 [Stephania cephalantha]|uniref:J domain-containing protein required for chloroplast accumulation response 1 n=1 Tax=Stephania cephalantha TaxID=152367 RepID=A0AAP0IDL6_9MAGN